MNLGPLFLLLGAIAFAAGLLFGGIIGEARSHRQWQEDVIKRGYAEWRIIEGTPRTEFHWKDK